MQGERFPNRFSIFMALFVSLFFLSLWRVAFPEVLITENGFRITKAVTPYVLWTEVNYHFDRVHGKETITRHGFGPSFYIAYDYMCACVTSFTDNRSERKVRYNTHARVYMLDDGIAEREVPFEVVKDDFARAALLHARYSTKYWPKEYAL
ncbi:MAG: hypothetical protein HY457_02420 [Parcubacteria group bacterium]|nr:hypothetical protein [Parcubacteria group bacterium]